MIVIGIDPSINCTGVCVIKDEKCIYYMIPSKMTKKMKNFNNKFITILPYEKEEYTNLEYSEKEYIKTNNIYNICKLLEYILKKYKPSLVNMEGVSYGSTGSAALVDLSGLQYAIRMVFKKLNLNFKIISPTSAKKFAVGNGQAQKDSIIYAWKKLDKNIEKVNEIKIDDLADAYFLAHYKEAP